MLGFGTDGASVMNDVVTEMQRANPSVVVAHCVGHNFALAAGQSAEDVPFLVDKFDPARPSTTPCSPTSIQQTANSKQQATKSKQQTTNSKLQTANSKQQTEEGKSAPTIGLKSMTRVYDARLQIRSIRRPHGGRAPCHQHPLKNHADEGRGLHEFGAFLSARFGSPRGPGYLAGARTQSWKNG
jgi:hypothetical protein